METSLYKEGVRCFELRDKYIPDHKIYNLLNIDYSNSSDIDLYSAQTLLIRMDDKIYNKIKIDVVNHSTSSANEMVRASGVVLLSICLKKHEQLGFSIDDLECLKKSLGELRKDHSKIVIGNLRALKLFS